MGAIWGTKVRGAVAISSKDSFDNKAVVVVGNEKIKESDKISPQDLKDAIEAITAEALQAVKIVGEIDYGRCEHAFALGESSHAMGYSYDKLNGVLTNPYHLQVADGTVETVWLTFTKDGNSEFESNYVEFEAPMIVMIGDSIVEGHPNTHSRLHDSSGNVNLDLQNIPGQIPYHLSELFGTQVLNQGWGGARTDHTWNRWRRDVLGEVYDPGDVAGSKTLNQRAYGVIVSVGINDISMRVPLAEIQERMTLMAESCLDNNIYCTFLTVAPDIDMVGAKITNCLALNEWMRTELAKKVEVLDLQKFATNGTNSWSHRTDFSAFNADKVHFTAQMNAAVAQFIADNTKNPFFLKEIIVESNISPVLSHITRAQDVEFTSGGYSKTVAFEDQPIQRIPYPVCRSSKQRVAAYSVHDLSKTYWTISGIKSVFERRK